MGNNQLRQKIKKLRQKLESSQDDFARKVDVPYTTLTKIETGVIRKPSVFVIAKTVLVLPTLCALLTVLQVFD
jgi:DNA-binding XRE family transcriptional regulator